MAVDVVLVGQPATAPNDIFLNYFPVGAWPIFQVPTTQGQQQASIEKNIGFSDFYNEDWMHLWDKNLNITDTNWNGRMLDWINKELKTAYTNLPGAMVAYAQFTGKLVWQSMGTFDAAPNKLRLYSGQFSGQIYPNQNDVVLR